MTEEQKIFRDGLMTGFSCYLVEDGKKTHKSVEDLILEEIGRGFQPFIDEVDRLIIQHGWPTEPITIKVK
jgi:hypothetical protein